MTSQTTKTPSNDTLNTETDERILAELSRILASPQFTGTSRSKRFLEYIVKETLSGRGDELKGYSIALDVFDKSTNFDSNQNTVVRVQATQVRRRLKLYYADNADHTDVHISLPTGRYKPVFLTDTSQPNLAKVSGLSLISNLGRPILEIQPLKNHSEEQTYDSFADSITTELIHKLTELDKFQVKPGRHDNRILELQDKGNQQGIILPEIETQNDIDFTDDSEETYILSGCIRRTALNVRVTLLLASEKAATYIKTKAFEESFTSKNIFDAPERLAEKIVKFIEPY